MDNVTHLGLDVHQDSIAVGLLRPGREVPDHKVIDNTPEAIRKLVSRLDPTSLVACYEAGPTGYHEWWFLWGVAGYRLKRMVERAKRSTKKGLRRALRR